KSNLNSDIQSESCFTFIGRSLERWRFELPAAHSPFTPDRPVPGAVGETDVRRHKPRRTAPRCYLRNVCCLKMRHRLLRLRGDKQQRLAVAAFTSSDAPQAVVPR